MDSELENAKASKSNTTTVASGTLYPENYDSLHRSEYRFPTQSGYTLSQADYVRFRVFVHNRIGLDYTEDQRSMLGYGLANIMNLIGCANLDELYLRLSNTPTNHVLWDQVISELTVGETYFFRNTSHFDTLARHILPPLVAERAQNNRRIRIWSAGCATGEEPYSIAILLKETILDLGRWNISILATDINRHALKKAQAGRYSAWSFRGVDKRVQEKYFRREQDQYVISDDIKRMVDFDYLNLVADPFPSLTNHTNAMDVLMCRNVTIYFSEQITRSVVQRFRECLVDGGWLIPGASEPNLLFYSDFQARNFPGTVIYQKTTEKKTVPVRHATVPTVPSSKTASLDLYQQAMDWLRAGHMDEALKKLNEKIIESPNFAPAFVALGKIHANCGNLEEARRFCERAIQIDKLHPEPYYTLSLIYQQDGLPVQAIDMLKKTIYLDRRFVLAHYNLAQMYVRQNEPVLARKSLQNAQRLLEGEARTVLVPEGDGLIVGRLLDLIANQLAEVSES